MYQENKSLGHDIPVLQPLMIMYNLKMKYIVCAKGMNKPIKGSSLCGYKQLLLYDIRKL